MKQMILGKLLNLDVYNPRIFKSTFQKLVTWIFLPLARSLPLSLPGTDRRPGKWRLQTPGGPAAAERRLAGGGRAVPGGTCSAEAPAV